MPESAYSIKNAPRKMTTPRHSNLDRNGFAPDTGKMIIHQTLPHRATPPFQRPPEVDRASFDGGSCPAHPEGKDRRNIGELKKVVATTLKASSEGGYPVPDCFDGAGDVRGACAISIWRVANGIASTFKAVITGGVLE